MFHSYEWNITWNTTRWGDLNYAEWRFACLSVLSPRRPTAVSA